MMHRNGGVGAQVMSLQVSPVTAELAPLHRSLFAPGYVSDERVARGVRAKNVAFQLGDQVDSRLKPRYLARVIQIEDGLSWSKMFGNFMGTAAAFQALLNTAVQDEHGYVIQRDTEAIQSLLIAMQKYRSLVDKLEGEGVSNTMLLSARYCGGLVRELHELFVEADHWASVTSDGTVYIAALVREKLNDPDFKELPITNKPEDAVARLTAAGLSAFKAWAMKAADPNTFIEEFTLPQIALVGTAQPEIEIDKYSREGGLPLPHPSYASPVHRVLVELMSLAEASGMPALQFRYNGWRRAYETRVPISHVDKYLATVRQNEEMGSLRGEHDWWIERLGDQIKIVIPTQPTMHIDHFASYSKTVLRKVANVFTHIAGMDLTKEVDLDAEGLDGISLRAKLQDFEASFQDLVGMQKFLEAERGRDPSMKTQESYAVSALIERLLFSVRPYRDLYTRRNEPGELADLVDKCVNSNVFSLLEHIPGYTNRVPRVDVQATGPRIPFTPVKWIESHKLMVSLYALMVDIAGTFDEDSRHPPDVNISYTWDAANRRIIIANPDGRFVGYFRGLNAEKEPHLVPGPAREIYALSKKAAPPGRVLTVHEDKNIMYVPIAIQESAIPTSPSMASISAPHPSLMGSKKQF